MKTICYYHNDADGILSAAIVNHNVEGKKVFIKSDYGIKIDWELIEPDDVVYIVDFSFPPYEMDTMCLAAEKVVWIDHHISAIKKWEEHLREMRLKYPDFPDIEGIRTVGISGCQNTELYFRKDIPEWYNGSKNSRLVETIGTFDVWNKKNPYVSFDDAINCMLGMLERGLGPESEEFDLYFSLSYNAGNSPIADVLLTDALIDDGKIVQKYLDNYQNKKISESAFETILFGKKTIAVNCLLSGSQPLQEKYREGCFDLMCVYHFDGKLWKYSFYTEKDNVDCSFIAISLAKDDTKIGGGHKKAAGCSLTKNIFDNRIPILEETAKDMD